AKLYRGIDPTYVEARLDSLLQAPRGDMFWMFPVTTLYFVGRDHMQFRSLEKLRDAWRTYMPYRGDTENHWLLYYATLYLMSEAYPDDGPDRWYTGKSSQENMDEAWDYLQEWGRITTTIGQGEYDSPHYLKVYLAPLALLYGFAEDQRIRQWAEIMLDYIVADFAVEHIDGFYAGAHARLYEREVVQPVNAPSSRSSYQFFGSVPFMPSGESFILAVSGYRPPLILNDIALDRSEPYTHLERKRTRHRIRNTEVKNKIVYKTTRMRAEYAIGSSQGGLLQPIQQQTWDLTWAVDGDPKGIHNTFFALHPYSSPREGTMYFGEQWEMVTELIVRSKTEFASPDKWTGGSAYEQVIQSDDAVVALYDIDPDAEYGHISAFFSKDLSETIERESGWIIARGGDALIAFYPLAPYEWRDEESGDRRFHSPHRKNGYVVQAAPAGDFESLEAFAEAVEALPLETAQEPTPSVSFQTLAGEQIQFTYGETPVIAGTPVDYAGWPLYDGPFLEADVDSRRLLIKHGPQRRLLDLATLKITEWVE
ncbi:MAG: hypothetical protein AAF752_14975, partial [Bacteroidota bacterium]